MSRGGMGGNLGSLIIVMPSTHKKKVGEGRGNHDRIIKNNNKNRGGCVRAPTPS